MRWLVTVTSSVPDREWRLALQQASCAIDDDVAPIPLDDDLVVEVDGPDNLPELAKKMDAVVAVHPSSEMDLY